MKRTILVDGKEVNWRDLINRASKLDRDYRRKTLKLTSDAAKILRHHGHLVEEVYE